jgi:hypothetical protein
LEYAIKDINGVVNFRESKNTRIDAKDLDDAIRKTRRFISSYRRVKFLQLRKIS